MPIATKPPYHEPDYHGAPGAAFYSGRGPSIKQHDYGQPINGYTRDGPRMNGAGPDPRRINGVGSDPRRMMNGGGPDPRRVKSADPRRMNSMSQGNVARRSKSEMVQRNAGARMNGGGTERAIGGGVYDTSSTEGKLEFTYHIEHLCTFPMDRKDAVLTVEDALRKLKLMDAKGKIWSQDITLYVNQREVQIIDEQTQEVLEKFPLNFVNLVSAEMNRCNYDSVLVIQIKFPQKKHPEMFIFQCDEVQAEVIADEFQHITDKGLSRNKRYSRSDMAGGAVGLADVEARDRAMSPSRQGRYSANMERDMDIPPPPEEPAPLPPNENVRNRVAAFAAAAERQKVNGAAYQPRLQQPKPIVMSGSGGKENESIEMMALRTERDVQILNQCFDEIEAFIASLQKAADAYTELSRLRRQRKSKKREHGDGLLISRSRPPPEADYVDCFQKFKFAFNLLAKLKAHIHDPNAPELVHFLFIPLELVVQSCQGPELASSVVSPLLTPQAIELLRNCLTSRENDLWITLGRAWNTPKSAWPKDHYVPVYTPQFRNGWVPPPNPDSQHQEYGRNDNQRRSNYGQLPPQQQGTSSLGPPPTMTPTPPPAVVNSGQHSPRSLQPRISKATFDFVARNNKELTIMAGEILEILDDRRKWWEVRNSSGQQGFVPSTILEITNQPNTNASNSNSRIPTPPQQSPNGFGAPGSGQMLYHHHHNGHQPFLQDQVDGPKTPPVAPAPVAAPAPAPPPAPAIPPPPPAVPPLSQTNSWQRKSNTTNSQPAQTKNAKKHDELHDELMRRVNQGQGRNFNITRTPSTNTVPLTYNSTPAGVTKWLQSKRFSKLTVDSLGVLTGAQLFSLTKEELKQVCFDDGPRVYSQVMVARAPLEQKSTTSELALIMERRKVRSSSNESGSLDDNIPLNNPPPDFNPALPNV
ncbi:epidermal growth factor receptor kinase substrate 8-like protein 2 isoform X2 [Anneissia japonica]|uniref:epidermal growth factor receptor kinase substrate 8-like protein 2 isoform X2 n=1 Tax=Anneissia japonica TaxID=1529436 RepID=UPI0014259FB6|nr:epidermal growth factor receptor kinase substrate 8-like protein 2 isoform X2 [Anneissia japonica]